jgi:hypothetical protein
MIYPVKDFSPEGQGEKSPRGQTLPAGAPTGARIGKWIKPNVVLLLKKKKQTIWQW